MARGVSSAGRASALQAEGHRFEPCTPHQKSVHESVRIFTFYLFTVHYSLKAYGFQVRSKSEEVRGALQKQCFFAVEGLEPCGESPRANVRGMLVKNKPSVSLQRTPFDRHKCKRSNSLPTICTNPKCGEISLHGERGEVSGGLAVVRLFLVYLRILTAM